jgi:hypothetical protein
VLKDLIEDNQIKVYARKRVVIYRSNVDLQAVIRRDWRHIRVCFNAVRIRAHGTEIKKGLTDSAPIIKYCHARFRVVLTLIVRALPPT